MENHQKLLVILKFPKEKDSRIKKKIVEKQISLDKSRRIEIKQKIC